MLKNIKKDLLSLHGKFFGTYDVEPFKKDSPTIQFINYLINKKIETYPFGACWNYENFIFDDSKADEIKEVESDDSYNWDSPVTFQFRIFKYQDKTYTAINFHRYGDVRGNYTKYAVLNCDKEDFLDLLDNFNLEIPCEGWQIEQKITNEIGNIAAFQQKTGHEYNGYYRKAPKDVKKAVEHYFF